MNYVLWDSVDRGNSCAVLRPEGVERFYELVEGVPRAHDWPPDTVARMDPDYPKNMRLEDNLINTDNIIVASRRLKEFLQAKGVPKLEYLPITVINHKNRVASGDYFILHPIGLEDGFDQDRSDYMKSRLRPDMAFKVRKLVVKRMQIDPKAMLFRLKYYPYAILVRGDLAAEISRAGFTGIQWDTRLETAD